MTNKKPVIAVPTPEISKIVQEKLFELGYGWASKGKKYHDWPTNEYGKEAYLCIEINKIYYANRTYLENNRDDHYEITMYDLYQMEPMMPDSVKLFNEKGELVTELSRESLESLKKL